MGVFDSLLNETTTKFGISYNQAGSLLSALLGFMNQGGGVSEFLGRFRSGGLSNSVSSWLSGNPQAISADDLESGMGQSTVSAIASKAGVPLAAASSALAFMLPKVIQKIAPSGVVPSRIPSEMMSYLPESARVPEMRYSQTAPDTGRSSRLLWPVLGACALALLGIWLWQTRSAERAASRAATEVGRAGEAAGSAAARAGAAVEREASEIAGLRSGASGPELVRGLNTGTIDFAPGTAQIAANSYDFLNRAAESLRNAPSNTVVEVVGHAESSANPAVATQLAQQRADAVREYLVGRGVAPERLVARAYADSGASSSNRVVTFSAAR